MKIKRKVKGITYIYERTTDAEGKRYEKVIGKIDNNGEEMYCDEHIKRCISGGQWRGDNENTSKLWLYTANPLSIMFN